MRGAGPAALPCWGLWLAAGFLCGSPTLLPPCQLKCAPGPSLQCNAGLEITGFLFNSQFRPAQRLRAPSFKDRGASGAGDVPPALTAGKVRWLVEGRAEAEGRG